MQPETTASNDTAPRRPLALVLDDHPLVRSGITAFLRTHALLHDAVGVDDRQQLMAAIDAHNGEVIALVDFWLPTGSVDIAALREQWPALRVIVMSGDEDAAVQRKAQAAGAHGFLLKREDPATFARAVSAVATGRTWFQDRHGGADAPGGNAGPGLTVTANELGLSARQADVLNLLLMGQPNKLIARALNISDSTVKEHVTAVLHKLAVPTRAAAISKLRGCRLVRDDVS